MADAAAASRLKPAPLLLLTVLLPFGLGYYMSYMFRTVNAIISPQLVHDVGLSPGDLGVMTSAYFFTFAAAQLPLGIVLDKYGPRKVQAAMLLIAAVGAVLFSIGHDAGSLLAARALVGAGVSGSLMAALKANVMWFPRERLPLLNGLVFAFGTSGALSTTVPLEMLIHTVDWRTVFVGLAVLSALVGLFIYFVVPERTPEQKQPVDGQSAFASQIDDLRQIYGNAFFWRMIAMVVLHNGVFLAYQSLWAAPWLRDVAGLDQAGVADGMFMFNAGMFAGVLSLGLFAERLQKMGVPPLVFAGGGIALSLLVQCAFAAQWTAHPDVLCLLFGYFGSSSVLVYAVFNQKFPARLVGRVNTAQNMLTFSAAFAVQWLIGVVIGMYPSATAGTFSPEGHQVALIAAIAVELVGFVYFVWPRRSRNHEPA